MRLAAASAARALPARGRTGRPGVRTKSRGRGGELAGWIDDFRACDRFRGIL